jgi:chorismate mutase
MQVRGIRGAISVDSNNKNEIYNSTKKLLKKIVSANMLEVVNICSIIFTVTEDLNAAFPAAAAREMGWKYVPMICLTELSVPGSSVGILRILIHVNTDKKMEDIKHVYLGEAVKLRPDLSDSEEME